MTLQLLHSEFPYICGKFDFLFYQCGAYNSLSTTQYKKVWYHAGGLDCFTFCSVGTTKPLEKSSGLQQLHVACGQYTNFYSALHVYITLQGLRNEALTLIVYGRNLTILVLYNSTLPKKGRTTMRRSLFPLPKKGFLEKSPKIMERPSLSSPYIAKPHRLSAH